MSKSKKNVVDPEFIINNYGADAVRLFILSDSPPEKDVQWSEQGMVSAYKFIQKLWILHRNIKNKIFNENAEKFDEGIDKFTNQLVAKLTDNLEKFNYNVIIANMYETFNYLSNYIKQNKNLKNLEINYKKILICFSPIVPHFTSECMSELNIKHEIQWPDYDLSSIQESDVNIVIQINGKKRAILNVKKDISENDLLKIAKENKLVDKYLKNKSVKNIIFVQNRLINILTHE